MDLKNFDFDLKKFYPLGMVCFSLVIVGSTYSVIYSWGVSNIGNKLSAIATIVFDFGLVALFNYFRKEQKDESIDLSESDMDKLLG